MLRKTLQALLRGLCLLMAALLLCGAPALAGEEPVIDPDDLYTDSDDGLLILIDRVNGSDSTWEVDPARPWLHVWFPQIRDADAAVIRCGSEVVLIDCGDASQVGNLIDLLQALGVSRVSRLINTHPHHDHIEGLAALAEVITIDELDICFHESYNDRMLSLMEVAKAYGIPVRHYGDEDSIALGAARLTAYLKGDADWNCNELSAVLRLELEQRSFLFMADATERTMQRLAAQPDPTPWAADIIKAPHHGVTPLTNDFLDLCHPLLSIITNTNRVTDTIYQCKRSGIGTIFTASGAVHCVTDGEVWVVEPFEP